MHFYLMCGGAQKRMGEGAPPKQLTIVDGEPLILRTLRQLKEVWLPDSNDKITIVCPDRPAWRAVRVGLELEQGIRVKFIAPWRPLFMHTVLDVARRLSEYAASHAAFMCGDVVWSNAFLEAFLDLDSAAGSGRTFTRFAVRNFPNKHSGRASVELYGFRFNVSSAHIDYFDAERTRIAAVTAKAPEHLRDIIAERNWRPWGFLHYAYEHFDASIVETPFDDYTDDIDSPDDLATLPLLEAAIRAEKA